MLDAYLVEQIKEQKQRLQEDYLDNTCKLEKGKAYPDFRRLKRLAKRYGVYKDAEGRFVQVSGGTLRGGVAGNGAAMARWNDLTPLDVFHLMLLVLFFVLSSLGVCAGDRVARRRDDGHEPERGVGRW